MLSRLGYTADLAPDGQRTLDAIENAEYDLILMDIQMPTMNGIDAARLIREKLGAKCPVIFALTAEALEGDKERFLGLGFDGYLSKPVQTHTLQATLRTINSRPELGVLRPAASSFEKLKTKFPTKASSIQIRQGDANESLVSWIGSQNWKKTRAVVFLDPYGMQIEWGTLKALGQTCGVDLWLLFPLGVGVMRLLTKSSPPPEAWSQRITRMLGTSEWENKFYGSSADPEFFPDFAPAKTKSFHI
jgi:CheY-like chemotaxis protein